MKKRKHEAARRAASTAAGLCIALFTVLAVVSCPLPTHRDRDETNNPSTDHLSMLAALGLDTDLGPVRDPDGNPVAGGYNPLGRKRGMFHPLEEIYFAGFAYRGKNQYLVDDHQAGLAGLYSTTDDSWAASTYKNCIGADVDGDGFEEVVVVYYASGTLHLKVIDNPGGGGIYNEYSKQLVTGITGNLPVYPQYQPALAKGDLDGDGRDELILGFAYYAYIVDDKASGYAVTSRNYPNSRDLYIASGDLDGDSRDEFIITYNHTGYAYCDVFDGSFSAPFLARYEYTLHASNLSVTFEQAVHVAMGDIDGDRFDEIVVHGETQGGNRWALCAMDDAKDGFAWLDFITWTYRDDLIGIPHSPALAILDYNGDGLDDIFASLAVMDYKVGSSSGHPFSPINTNVELIKSIFTDAVSNVWAGDVDGDTDDPLRKDEIVYFYDGKLWIGGQDALGNHQHQTTVSGACNAYSTLCLANVDDDTPIIEYTGDHELLFTDPTVIAALACPPYHGNCGQNIGSCGTTFGRSSGQVIEEAKSTGVSVGFSIGYEYEDPFGVSKVSFKLTVEEALDWISSESSEVEKYIAYTSGPDEDKVIFTAIPFDVYYYTVISSPNPSEVGKPMTINIPRKMQTLSVARSFYNANNGDHPDVDSQVLQHSIGNVSSYPSLTERNALLADGGLYSELSPVGVGSGSITLGISTTEGQGTGTFSDFSVTVESEVGAGGVTAGVSAGFHYGHEYTVTNTQSTVYEGTVGDIPVGSWSPDKGYSFGLFTYPISPASFGGQRFTLVNCWIE